METKKLFLLFFIFIPYVTLLADEELSNESGVRSNTSLILQLSSLPEAKMIFSQNFIVPIMQGDGALTRGNNIRFGIDAEITPISMGLLGKAVFTPIAFIELSAGGIIGSGWVANLFGSELRGIGINVPDEDGKTSVNGSAFDGAFVGANFGGAFQFDLGAVIPGAWNHVLFRTYHEASIMTYSRANRSDPWFFENDNGENQNGWTYLANFTLGYQMPLFLNVVALQAEMERYLFNYPDSDSWGGRIGRWDFGLVMNFRIVQQFSAMLVTQFRLHRNYKDDNNDNYYQNRVYTDSRTLKFYRVAAILTYRLR